MRKFRGLPKEKRMRHDAHFVDSLVDSRPPANDERRASAVPLESPEEEQDDSVGRLIPIEQIDANPDQPRKLLGDLTGLRKSIQQQGVLEPLLVRRHGERFEVIAGERRLRAATEAGLSKVPCIELELDGPGTLEVSLIENLQRRDLTAFEESEGMAALVEKFEYTHEMLSERLGKSRISVTESLGLLRIPTEVRDACRHADITSKSMLVEIAREPDAHCMKRLVERISEDGLSRQDVRRERQSQNPEGKPRPARRFSFNYAPPDRSFSLNLKFKHQQVEPEQLVTALEDALKRIRKDIQEGRLPSELRPKDPPPSS